ncbi:oxygen-independent coproporphyrinogen III oxidase-like protein [Pseudazoarcus pumilus]|uniref:Heme chaperone HemW n=1 Tax=Pseudazoarcus pumilus TaxID=2067960 RepID=A0A2I6S2Y2_9RHOO|nr:oxygen-independent coproporphyrinogen III oxidase-like protein [Pseudazoarcus pumilus]
MSHPVHRLAVQPPPAPTTLVGPAPAEPPPLSIYAHYPWCVRKCPYCDFNSHALRGGSDAADMERRYIDALIADVAASAPLVAGRSVDTVFFGGGTPSLMSPASLGRVIDAIARHTALAPDAEITLEANPGTFEAARFRGFREAGANRLSVGIQSFDDAHLTALGRIHDSAEARRAIGIAQDHFERVNLDLMYALPNQSLDAALSDVDVALAFGPEHLSGYHLTLEPNTPFHHSPPPVPDDDTAADMQEAIEARLREAGYDNYETSAFARAGARSRHNLNYWSFGDYLGVGAGAHGKLSTADGIVREMRHKHPQRYLDAARRGQFVQERRSVTADELPFEFMMNALRLADGVPAAWFEARTGLPLATITAELAKARAAGLLDTDDAVLRPTPRGRRFLNELLEIFL